MILIKHYDQLSARSGKVEGSPDVEKGSSDVVVEPRKLLFYVPFPVSTASASAMAWCASRGRLVNTTDADMVSGRSAPCSSSGIGAFLLCNGRSWAVVRLADRWLPLVLDALVAFCSGVGELWTEGSRDDDDSISTPGVQGIKKCLDIWNQMLS